MQSAHDPKVMSNSAALLAEMRGIRADVDAMCERLSESVHQSDSGIDSNVLVHLNGLRGRLEKAWGFAFNERKHAEQSTAPGTNQLQRLLHVMKHIELHEVLSGDGSSPDSWFAEDSDCSDVETFRETLKRMLSDDGNEKRMKRLRHQVKVLLPEQIIANILGNLSVSDIGNCRLVCHSWRDAIRNHSMELWFTRCIALGLIP